MRHRGRGDGNPRLHGLRSVGDWAIAVPSPFRNSPMTQRSPHGADGLRVPPPDVAGPVYDGSDEGETVGVRSTRGFLYWLARLLGDVQAVKKGRIGRRVGRRLTGRLTGRWLGRLFK